MRLTGRTYLLVAFLASMSAPIAAGAVTGGRPSAPDLGAPRLGRESPSVVSSGRLRNAAGARRYWTPARMANARPARVAKPRSSQAESWTTGASSGRRPIVRFPGASGRSNPVTRSSTEEPVLLHADSTSRPYTDLPDRTNGKVFFTRRGYQYVCSGTAVNSPNKSVVWTAGHCVEKGRNGDFHNNWVFIPGYGSSSNRMRPYGTWPARALWTTGGWAKRSNLHKDVGAAIVRRVDDLRLVDRVGGQGIEFNGRRDRHYRSFGYPAVDQFDGRTQWRCDSRYLGSDNPPGNGPRTMKIHCNMTGGSSGGAWLTGVGSDGLGVVRSVNSYGYDSQPDKMYGPYLGGAAQDLYAAVRGGS